MKKFIILLILLACMGQSTHAKIDSDTEIKLVLQITIDGLRGDLIDRYKGGFGDDGFAYLLKKGTVYTNAHYQHANTETIVGHTILATGAFPSENGMIGNVWFDDETGELSYNIEDPDAPILPTREETEKSGQLDPSQKISRTKGRSPSVILAASFSDTLAAYYGGRAKIFGVSGKDRGAVPMAGHTGKAFWYSTDAGDFVTSRYYYDAYPDWAAKWNAKRLALGYSEKSWTLLNDKADYLLAAQDDRPYETDLRGYGRVFPHPFGKSDDPLFFSRLLISPVGDQLTLDFSKAIIEHEKLGSDDVPDYLGISFSAVDAVNHFFGPSSLENEDIVVQLDRTLADLFSFVDKKVGLDKTLIVLSADHGMADMPEYMTELGYHASRLYPDDVIKTANAIGKQQFGIDEVTKFFYRPYLYLDHGKIKAAKLDISKVELAIAEALTDIDGVALAVSRSGLAAMETTPILAQIQRNYHPSRSGDIYVAQDPYWFLYEKGPIAGIHGSPWKYDTHVPIIFAGANTKSQTIHRLVHPVDVAPTLSAVLGMSAPSSTNGTVLTEIMP
ncbi:MAG: alkaline phosphatase family protein [Planctomycetota bacterium]|jgi:predicted AlkP superfamily pyrophosphatase or phosphodiesterase